MPTRRTAEQDCTAVRTLRHRAAHLADVAGELNPVLATAYRRRASELELEAWVREQVVEPTPLPVAA